MSRLMGIADAWIACVQQFDSRWTVDSILDVEADSAVIEWTHFHPRRGFYLRGDEWYRFSATGLIREIRAYYAAPARMDAECNKLAGYPSEGLPTNVTSPQACMNAPLRVVDRCCATEARAEGCWRPAPDVLATLTSPAGG